MRKELVGVTAIIILLLFTACTSTQAEDVPTEVVIPETSSDTSTNSGESIAEMAETGSSEAPADSSSDEAMMDSGEDDHPDEMMEESVDESMTSNDMIDDEEMMDSSSDDEAGIADDLSGDEDMSEESGVEEPVTVDRPAWQELTLVNARTGEPFKLADFEGKTIFVEPMATWCSNCRRQLNNVKDARQQLPNEDVVFVALSVETSIDDASLASYADAAGFDWIFAVATPDMIRQLADEFGQTIANPPATPHFIVRSDGSFTELTTGIETPEELVSAIASAQG